jgi:hypothetical protein
VSETTIVSFMSSSLHARWLGVGIAVSIVAAPETAAADATLSTSASHRWSIETEAIQPFVPTVGIIRARAARTVWGTRHGGSHADLVLGVYIRPHIEHDVVDYIDEYMATAGIRYFAWRGLHAEVLLNAGAAWGTNKLDGMSYRTPTLFGEINIGYRFGFFEPGGLAGTPRGVGLFVMPQVGILSSLGVGNDIGPRNGKPDYFLTAALFVGVSF